MKEAIEEEVQEHLLIGDVELAMQEGLRQIGQQALANFLEAADAEVERETECACGGRTEFLPGKDQRQMLLR